MTSNRPQEAPRSFTPTRRSDTPRRVRQGLKLNGRLQRAISEWRAADNAAPAGAEAAAGAPSLESDASTPGRQAAMTGPLLVRQWLSLMEGAIAQTQLESGLTYARLGQIVSMEMQPGEIVAHVQGTDAKPYLTRLRVQAFTAEHWEAIIEAMAGEAVYVAKLLAGELPSTIQEMLARFGLRLLPHDAAELRIECSCPFASDREQGGPCKHAAAVGYLMAERLLEAPAQVFSFLGMPVDALLERVQRSRMMQSHGLAAAHTELTMPDDQAAPLETCLTAFWKIPLRPSEWDEAQSGTMSHHVPHALLRRLGPSPLNGKFPLVGLLASVYDSVAQAARKLRETD